MSTGCQKSAYPGGCARKTVETEACPPAVGECPDILVKRYAKADGWITRYWGVYVGGKLLAVVVYKKGGLAIADALRGQIRRNGPPD